MDIWILLVKNAAQFECEILCYSWMNVTWVHQVTATLCFSESWLVILISLKRYICLIKLPIEQGVWNNECHSLLTEDSNQVILGTPTNRKGAKKNLFLISIKLFSVLQFVIILLLVFITEVVVVVLGYIYRAKVISPYPPKKNPCWNELLSNVISLCLWILCHCVFDRQNCRKLLA